MMTKPEVVLDKSYLQGAPAPEIRRLCDDYHVIMPGALFFELMTSSDPQAATTCFAKIPARENPLILIDSVGAVMRAESQRGKQASPLAEVAPPLRYVLNPKLAAGTFQLTAAQAEAVRRWEVEIENDVEWLRKLHGHTADWFPEIEAAEPSKLPGVIDWLKSEIALDAARVRTIYSKIRHPSFPEAKDIGPGWVFFAYLQVYLLAVLEYLSPGAHLPSDKKLENEVADLQYRVMAVVAGGFATQENRNKETFQLLRPDGVLVDYA